MASFLETLMALNRGGLPPMPAPAQPMQMFLPSGGASEMFAPTPNPMPGPAATVPMPELDMDLINRIAGPAPVQQDPSFLDKLAVILQGIGAGGQGQGPQFAQSVREQRERPQREFEARRARGVEAAEEKRIRQQEQAQRRADIQAEREFDLWLKKTGVQDQMAVERMREAFVMQKQREAERAADERQATAQKAQQEQAARLIARDYGKMTANPKIALELGRYYAGLTDTLSPEAAKFETAQARLAEARLRRGASGPADPFAGMSVETDQGIVPLKVYAALKDVLGQPKRFIMPGGSAPVGDGAPSLTAETIRTTIANNPNMSLEQHRQNLLKLAKTEQEKATVEAEIKLARKPAAPRVGSAERPLLPAVGQGIQNLFKNNPNAPATPRQGYGQREPVK